MKFQRFFIFSVLVLGISNSAFANKGHQKNTSGTNLLNDRKNERKNENREEKREEKKYIPPSSGSSGQSSSSKVSHPNSGHKGGKR